MENILDWLEELKTMTVSECYKMNIGRVEEDCEYFNNKLSKIENLVDFVELEKEITNKCTMTFATRKEEYFIIPDKLGYLVDGDLERETKSGTLQTFQSETPEKVVRYWIYDNKANRDRRRKSHDFNIGKQLKVVPVNNEEINAMVDDLVEKLNKKLVDLKERSKRDDTLHIIKCADRLKRLGLIQKIHPNMKKLILES